MSTISELLTAATAGYSPWKFSVDVVATSAITLAGTQTIDGVALQIGNRVLPTAQAAGRENVPRVVQEGAWTYVEEMDRDAKAPLGCVVFVRRGTLHGGSIWLMSSPTTGEIKLGSTSLAWSKAMQIGNAGGDTIEWKRPADGAGGDQTAEENIWRAPGPRTITAAHIEAVAALTAHDTNNATLTLRKRDGAGGAAVTVAAYTTNVASGGLTAWIPKSLGALTNTSFVAGNLLTAEVTKAGSGVIIPQSLVSVTYALG